MLCNLQACCHRYTIWKESAWKKIINEWTGQKVNWNFCDQLKQNMIQNLPQQPTDVNLSLLTDSSGLGSGFYISEKYGLDFVSPYSWAWFSRTCKGGLLGTNLILNSTVLCLFLLFLERFQGIRLMITHLGDVCQLINKGEQILFILSRQKDIVIILSKPSNSGLPGEHFFPFLSEKLFWW